jgi:hypothetical protein
MESILILKNVVQTVTTVLKALKCSPYYPQSASVCVLWFSGWTVIVHTNRTTIWTHCVALEVLDCEEYRLLWCDDVSEEHNFLSRVEDKPNKQDTER